MEPPISSSGWMWEGLPFFHPFARIVVLLFTALGLLWSLDSYGRLRKKRRSEAGGGASGVLTGELRHPKRWRMETNQLMVLWFRTGHGPPNLWDIIGIEWKHVNGFPPENLGHSAPVRPVWPLQKGFLHVFVKPGDGGMGGANVATTRRWGDAVHGRGG